MTEVPFVLPSPTDVWVCRQFRVWEKTVQVRDVYVLFGNTCEAICGYTDKVCKNPATFGCWRRVTDVRELSLAELDPEAPLWKVHQFRTCEMNDGERPVLGWVATSCPISLEEARAILIDTTLDRVGTSLRDIEKSLDDAAFSLLYGMGKKIIPPASAPNCPICKEKGYVR